MPNLENASIRELTEIILKLSLYLDKKTDKTMSFYEELDDLQAGEYIQFKKSIKFLISSLKDTSNTIKAFEDETFFINLDLITEN